MTRSATSTAATYESGVRSPLAPTEPSVIVLASVGAGILQVVFNVAFSVYWRNWNFARAQARRLLRDQSARLQTDVCPKARS